MNTISNTVVGRASVFLLLAGACGTSNTPGPDAADSNDETTNGEGTASSGSDGSSGMGTTEDVSGPGSDSDSDDGSSSDDGLEVTPTVLSNDPLNGAVEIPINGNVNMTFSEPMDPSTITTAVFTLSSGTPAVPVGGTVIYARSTAVFWPSEYLEEDSTYTVRMTTDARSAAGVPLAADHEWSFTTGDSLGPTFAVDLGAAADFVVLAQSGISSVPPSVVTGDIGVSPAAATSITGFSLTLDATNVFSTSSQVSGRVYAADYALPTPSEMTQAIGDMQLAFDDAAGRAPDVTELGAGDIGGMTLDPGIYRWGTSLLIPTELTLSGAESDVWILQIAGDLTVSSGTTVQLAGGAVPENVFWQVAGLVDLGSSAHVEGSVLAATAITLRTGASVDGRLLAQTAVNLDTSTLVEP